MKDAQPGSEQAPPLRLECLLAVSGDTALLNTFDKAFRSGFGPQWADRPEPAGPRYSFHALYPERQKKCQNLTATAIVNICWKAIDGRSVT